MRRLIAALHAGAVTPEEPEPLLPDVDAVTDLVRRRIPAYMIDPAPLERLLPDDPVSDRPWAARLDRMVQWAEANRLRLLDLRATGSPDMVAAIGDAVDQYERVFDLLGDQEKGVGEAAAREGAAGQHLHHRPSDRGRPA
jgi:hypothetical protein